MSYSADNHLPVFGQRSSHLYAETPKIKIPYNDYWIKLN